MPLVLFSTSSSAQLSAESFQSTPAKRTLEDDVRQLLSDAEAALASNKLTTPLHDNAFDRFQAVLLLRPNNQQAKTGLQQIFARYAALTRSALASSQLHQAREYIERAKFVDKNSPEISQLIKEVAIAQQRLNETRVVEIPKADDKEISLDPYILSQRNEQVVNQLQILALHIKESDESLLIYARNDSEGRWIYKTMSEGIPGYRLRGDIRLAKTPKIVVLPPIE
ncbi:hypothetical protein NBRC116493_06840 [Aurantivibrio infirmus]